MCSWREVPAEVAKVQDRLRTKASTIHEYDDEQEDS